MDKKIANLTKQIVKENLYRRLNESYDDDIDFSEEMRNYNEDFNNLMATLDRMLESAPNESIANRIGSAMNAFNEANQYLNRTAY